MAVSVEVVMTIGKNLMDVPWTPILLMGRETFHCRYTSFVWRKLHKKTRSWIYLSCV